jgi:hypothetical protein
MLDLLNMSKPSVFFMDRSSLGVLVVFASLVVLPMGISLAAGASQATPSQGLLLQTTDMVGNVGGPAPGSPVIAGIEPAGAAWVVSDGAKVSLHGNGELDVSAQGLVLASTGTVPAGLMVEAQLACQTSTGWTYEITSQVPLSSNGNAQIDQMITLPSSPCYAPIVLITHQNAITGAYSYFAATGY